MVMGPLSRRTRLFVLAILITLFFIILPVVILYASGWRWKGGTGLVRTGGVSVTIPYDGATITINGEVVGSSGFMNRRFYVDDLLPDAYAILVSKEGYSDWEHTLIVEPQIVTDARAFFVPRKISLLGITAGTSTATTTRAVDPETYDSFAAAFAAPQATSTLGAYDRAGDEAVFVENGDVYVRWVNEEASPTSNFCGRPSYCSREIAIEDGRQKATGAAYFAGGVVYRTKEGGVFIRENTVLPGAVFSPILARRGADFRIVGGEFVLKDGKNLYQVAGL